MSESYPCPQCGEVLDVPSALAHAPVRCGACSRVFTPREPTLASEFDAEPLPRKRRRRESEEPLDGGSNGRRVLFIVFGVVGVCGLLCCGGLGFFIFKMMNPEWQAFESPEGHFTANFPKGKVTPGKQPTGRGGETAEGFVGRRPMIQEEYFVYYVPLNGDVRKSEKLLHEIADALMKQWPAAKEVRDRVLRDPRRLRGHGPLHPAGRRPLHADPPRARQRPGLHRRRHRPRRAGRQSLGRRVPRRLPAHRPAEEEPVSREVSSTAASRPAPAF